jgi:hypothetical protein
VEEYKDFKEGSFYQKADTASLEKSHSLTELKQLALKGAETDDRTLKEKIEAIRFDTFKTMEPKQVAALFRNNSEVFKAAIHDREVIQSPKQGLYDYLLSHIEPSLQGLSWEYQQHILKCIVRENSIGHPHLEDILQAWELFIDQGIDQRERHNA